MGDNSNQIYPNLLYQWHVYILAEVIRWVIIQIKFILNSNISGYVYILDEVIRWVIIQIKFILTSIISGQVYIFAEVIRWIFSLFCTFYTTWCKCVKKHLRCKKSCHNFLVLCKKTSCFFTPEMFFTQF